MLKKSLWKSVVLAGVVVAMLFSYNNKVLSQGTEAVSTEENIPTKKPLIVKYLPFDTTSADRAFGQVDPQNIELQKQDKAFPEGGGSIKELEIRGFHNGETIFFRLTWADATKNETTIKHEQFRDAVAIMFPLDIVTISPDTPFSPRMGDRGRPVNLWHWKADWEKDLQMAGKYVHVEDEYVNMFDDFSQNPFPVPFHKVLYSSTEHVSGGRAAGNLLSNPGRGRSVEDLNAVGFGTLTSQAHQDVIGKGNWAGGKWGVVISRPLVTPDNNDVQFVPGMATFFNVAVWNGSQGDTNGQKSISIRWRPMKIERTKYQE